MCLNNENNEGYWGILLFLLSSGVSFELSVRCYVEGHCKVYTSCSRIIYFQNNFISIFLVVGSC